MAKASTVTLPEQEIIRRARIAGDLLDKEPGGRLGWLVRFVREGPAKTPGALESQGEQLLACALGPLPPNLVSFGPDPDAQRSTFSPADVRRFHRELRDWFHALVSYPGAGLPGVKVPMKGYRMVLVRMTFPGEKPAIFATSLGGPLKTMLFHRAAQWIIATDRLVACPECGRPVLALRRRLFCPAPAPCLQKHHDRKKIAARKNGGTT